MRAWCPCWLKGLEMLQRDCLDGKNREAAMKGHEIDGIPVRRCVGMIYWYSWGEHAFDIRVMREVLGLPIDHPLDTWFMAKKPDSKGSFKTIMSQLHQALGDRKFLDAMAQHDERSLEKRRETIKVVGDPPF